MPRDPRAPSCQKPGSGCTFRFASRSPRQRHAENSTLTLVFEVFDPATDHWTATSGLGAERAFTASTLLSSGVFLITGGDSAGTPVASTALYGERIFTDDFEPH